MKSTKYTSDKQNVYERIEEGPTVRIICSKNYSGEVTPKDLALIAQALNEKEERNTQPVK